MKKPEPAVAAVVGPRHSIQLTEKQTSQVILSILGIAFDTECLIIAAGAVGDPGCNLGWFPPANWLLMESVVSIIWSLAFIIAVARGKHRIQLLGLFVSLAWNAAMLVIGAVSFWAENPGCAPDPLRNIVLVTLILKLVSVSIVAMCHRVILD